MLNLRNLAALLLVAVATLTTVPANAAPTTVCDSDSDLTGAYIRGNVVIPKGESCVLLEATVTGNVRGLHAPANVRILDSNIGGNILLRGVTGLTHIGQRDCRFDPPVDGNVHIRNSNHVLVCYVTGHQLDIKGTRGRLTVRDNVFHQVKVRDTRATTAKRDSVRVLRNDAKRITVSKTHPSRKVIARGNTPDPIVR